MGRRRATTCSSRGGPWPTVITTCPDVENLFVVPATIDLAGAEIELVSVVAREQRLHKVLHADSRISREPVETAGEDRFDFVFIDCPPSLGLLTINALVAGQEMLIPIQAEYYALEGLGQLLVHGGHGPRPPQPGARHLGHPRHDVRRPDPAGGRRRGGGPRPLRRPGHQDLHPALGARVRGAVVQPDRDDLRPRLARRDELSRRRPRARGEGAAAPGRTAQSERAPDPAPRPRPRPRLTHPDQRAGRRGAHRHLSRARRRAGSLRPSKARPSPTCRSTRSGRTRPSPGRSSTRRRWPSWCTRSARSDCSSPSSCVAPGAGQLRAGDGGAAVAGRAAGRAEHHPGHHPRHRRHRHAPRRAAGEPAPRRS